jgi:hypothetical protein
MCSRHRLAVVPQTLTYSSELPLPMPLQCDSIEGGARLGFIAIRRGAITMVRLPTPRASPSCDLVPVAMQCFSLVICSCLSECSSV